MTCVLVWFRNDLRVHDHEPLLRAVQSGLPVVGLYCFDPRHYQTIRFDFPKTGVHRARFITESVVNLRESMNKLGLSLIVKVGKPEEVITELSETLDIKAVYYHHEIGSEEKEVEHHLKAKLPSRSFFGYYGHNLYHVDDLPFTINDLPDVYTDFRKIIEEKGRVRPILPTPINAIGLPIEDEGNLPSEYDLGLITSPETVIYSGGAREGKKRLRHYFYETDRISTYKETRNGMLERDDSSKLSPYLAHGCLSPRFIYWQLKEYENERIKNKSTYWLYFELLWRDYFYLVHLKFKNKLFHKGGLFGLSMPWSEDEEKISAWLNGKTGYPLVDANMIELKTTGYMSNRGRQNVASFLTKNLGVDWRIGAAWFESCLIDYDVSSNYGNWCYSAGVGNDVRGFRVFNVAKQGKDYDPTAAYAKYWLPPLKTIPSQRIYDVHAFTAFDWAEYDMTLGEDYPEPVVDLAESARIQRAIYEKAMRKKET